MKAMSHKQRWDFSHKKHGSRIHLFSQCGKDVEAGMFAPGSGQKCLRTAIEMGVVGKKTFIVAFERDHKTAKLIQDYLDSLPNPSYLHVGPLHTFHNMGDVLNGRKLEVAFYDFCGQVDAPTTGWIMRNHMHHANGCVIGYTVSSIFRTHENRRELITSYMRKFRRGNEVTSYVKNALSGRVHIDTSTSDFDMTKWEPPMVARNRAHTIQVSAEVVSLIFGTKVDINSIYSYRDTTGMNVIVGRKTGKVVTSVFQKFSTFMRENFPEAARKHRCRRGRMANPKVEHRARIVSDLIADGINYNGRIKITAMQKAMLTRLCKDTGKSEKRCMAGIRASVKRKTGNTAEIITVK